MATVFSRMGAKRPCVVCGKPTVFVRVREGKREDCCTNCGERLLVPGVSQPEYDESLSGVKSKTIVRTLGSTVADRRVEVRPARPKPKRQKPAPAKKAAPDIVRQAMGGAGEEYEDDE